MRLAAITTLVLGALGLPLAHWLNTTRWRLAPAIETMVALPIVLPPTLIAGIYGMNFEFFPELQWRYGYFIALGLMLASAILPYFYFRWRRWI